MGEAKPEGGQLLTSDEVAMQLEMLLNGLAMEGVRVKLWKMSRRSNGREMAWQVVGVRDNDQHGTLISKGW